MLGGEDATVEVDLGDVDGVGEQPSEAVDVERADQLLVEHGQHVGCAGSAHDHGKRL